MDNDILAPAYLLTFDDHRVASDELPDLIDAIIAGYSGMSDEEALVARTQVLAVAVGAAQENLVETNQFEAAPTDEQLTALLRDKAEPIPFPMPQWGLDMPLMELSVHYIPYTEAPAPAGSVTLFDPVDERAFLTALTALGLVDFRVAR